MGPKVGTQITSNIIWNIPTFIHRHELLLSKSILKCLVPHRIEYDLNVNVKGSVQCGMLSKYCYGYNVLVNPTSLRKEQTH